MAKQGRYQIIEQIGAGGMGMVYAARDTELDRVVALKTITPELRAHPEARAIFAQEARMMARMRHPNLPRVHDVLRQGQDTTLIMELVEGDSLEDILLGHPGGLPLEEVLHLWLQLLAALAWMHRQGIIHRDIKPSNLMINQEGTLQLMDFGLARELHTIAQKGTRVRGTPAYMAPEQILGGELGPGTDLYATAVTVFELLTGRLPFHEGDIAYHHLHSAAPLLHTLRPDAPVALSQLLNSCLQKDPQARPQSAAAVMRQLIQRLHLHRATLPPSVLSELKLSPLRNSGVLWNPHPTHPSQPAPVTLAPPTPEEPAPTPTPQGGVTPQTPRWLPAALVLTALLSLSAVYLSLSSPQSVESPQEWPHPARAQATQAPTAAPAEAATAPPPAAPQEMTFTLAEPAAPEAEASPAPPPEEATAPAALPASRRKARQRATKGLAASASQEEPAISTLSIQPAPDPAPAPEPSVKATAQPVAATVQLAKPRPATERHQAPAPSQAPSLATAPPRAPAARTAPTRATQSPLRPYSF